MVTERRLLAPMRQRWSGVILLVEDEDMVRRVAGRIFARLGFEVHTVPGGLEALDWLADHDEPLTAAIVDVNMPVMDGPTLLGHLRVLRPGVPVVLMSGGMPPFRAKPQGWLAKPFSMKDVSNLLAELLGHAAP